MIIRDLDDDLAILNNDRMNNKFLQACRDGNLELIKELYSQHSKTILKNRIRYSFYKLGGIESNTLAILNPYYYNNSPLSEAFANNHYEIVEFLLTNKHFIKGYNQDNYGFNLGKGLSKAIEHANLKMIDFVLPLIKDTANNFYNDMNHGFMAACRKGNIEVIDYVLFHPQIKKILQENEDNSFNIKQTDYFYNLKEHGFIGACRAGNIETVKYFTNKDSNISIDIHSIVNNNLIIVGSFEVLEYFIFNLNIDRKIYEMGNLEPSEALGDFIEINQKIKEMFDKRELFKEINNELKIYYHQESSQTKKKPKL
jgi:hypothetical protein